MYHKINVKVPADCRSLIEELKGSTQTEFLQKLRGIETWTYGLSHLISPRSVDDVAQQGPYYYE